MQQQQQQFTSSAGLPPPPAPASQPAPSATTNQMTAVPSRVAGGVGAVRGPPTTADPSARPPLGTATSSPLASSAAASANPSPTPLTRPPGGPPASAAAGVTAASRSAANSGSNASAAAAGNGPAASTSFASAKNTATQRKVAKLLDITTSSDIKDLASYVDGVLPGYFYNVEPEQGQSHGSSGSHTGNSKTKGEGDTASTSSNAGGAANSGVSGGTRAITSATLRSALDHRAIDMHKSFLQEFTAVYQNFQRMSAKVNELQEKCTGLENALSSSTGGSASAADDFFYQIQMHQAELQLVQHHEKEVDDFRKQHHFGPAEQQVLDDGPVDMNFLNVLERAREVHRRSSELMQSQEYHQGAAAVMESTYAAIARATEKIARHLLATAGTASGSAAGGVGRGGGGGAEVGANAAATTGGGVGSIAADVPEVTGFQLRCVRLLYEESPSLHEKFLDEVARLRRASVLRRYFHLLTTGSANTASGMYQSGGQPRGDGSGGNGGDVDGDAGAAGMGARPLEAELNNPTYFFSSLCAWLHQTIVEEQDFLHTFFMNDEADAQAGRRGSAGQGAAGSAGTATAAAAPYFVDAERMQLDVVRQQALLDTVFGGVCKHIRAALDNVLERLGRAASTLGAAKGEGQTNSGNNANTAGGVVAAGAGEDGVGSNTTSSGNNNNGSSNTPPAPQKGPRGLTGGLTRLFMAATGRTPLGPFRRKAGDEASALLQRYATVTSRAQQEAVASSLLHGPLQGVQTCVTLVQLFEYYSVTTFTPLLGEESALTRLIRETAPQLTRDVFQRLLRVLAAHLLDSTAGVLHRTATLRRLASSNALNSTGAGVADAAAGKGATNSGPSSSSTSPASMYILNFLTAMTYGEDGDGVSNNSVSLHASDSRTDLAASASASSVSAALSSSNANAKFRQASDGQLQRHSAQDLKRVLGQLILPPSPEVEAYCSVLHAVLRDTARQADLLQAISEQHHQQQVAAGTYGSAQASNGAGGGDAPAFHLRTEVKGFVRALLQALWRSAQSVQDDATLRGHLDDPCRAILQYNVLYQLQDIMEEHSDVLEMLCAAAATDDGKPRSDGQKVQQEEEEEEVDMRHDVETLRAEVGAAMNGLRRRLLSQWAAAVTHFYFPLSTEAVVASVLGTTTPANAAETDDPHGVGAKREVRQVLKQVVNVYNTIASMGHLPEPVPLLTSLCGSEAVRREVGAEVTKNVVERVYPAAFAALQRLPPSEELTAVQAEMSPQNLALLVDFGSPSAAAV